MVVTRLDALDLAFGYHGHPVGRDVTLSAGAGEVLCLLGPNGCGKTTLFKTLLGLLPAQAGSVHLDGQPLHGLARAEIARRIAYVPQAQATPFPFTVLDVVLMGRAAHRGLFSAPNAADRVVAAAALGDLGIGHLAARNVNQLSGGQRQLVIIARALAQAAPLIVMDEPTASLDFGNQVVVLARIKALAARGVGIVLSTHNPDHAFAVADRVALMRDGTVLALGPPADVLTAPRLAQVYGVDVSIERLPGGQTICAPDYGGSRASR